MLQIWNWKPAVRNREGWRRKIDRPWPENRMKRHKRRRRGKRRRGGGEEEDDDDEGERGRKNGEKVVDVGNGKGKVHCMTCCRPFRVLVVPTTCATNFF